MPNEIATQEDLLQKYGAAATSGEDTEGNSFPVLIIKEGYQKDAKGNIKMDKKGIPVKTGVFTFKNDEDSPEFENLKFMPLGVFERFKSWNDEYTSVVNETIFVPPFKYSEAIDKLGGVACGRPLGSNFKNLSPEAQKKWRDISKIYVVLFGFIELDGEYTLVALDYSGEKSRVIRDAIDSVKGHALYSVAFDMSAILDKGGKYYNLVMKQDKSYEQNLDVVLPLLKQMDDIKESTNAYIRTEHVKARQEEQEDKAIEAQLSDVIETVSEEVEDIDLDDDLPL